MDRLIKTAANLINALQSSITTIELKQQENCLYYNMSVTNYDIKDFIRLAKGKTLRVIFLKGLGIKMVF